MEIIPDTKREYRADLVLLAMGFIRVIKDGLVTDLGLELTEQGNINVDENYMTNIDGVFAAGDAKRGPSLVVWAIHEGKETAREINRYLTE